MTDLGYFEESTDKPETAARVEAEKQPVQIINRIARR